jgi:tRNA threonylcarbamoyladenosine biosynthesis protein TsaE
LIVHDAKLAWNAALARRWRPPLCDGGALRHIGRMATHPLPDLARVAARLRPGDAVLLEGALGAGKTAFARALLRAATANPALEVPSPSYTLIQSYDTPHGMIHHFDLWRLDGPAALAELGWDDATRDIVLVEWPDRLGALRPPDALSIAITCRPDDTREAELSGWTTRPSWTTDPGWITDL